MKSCYDSSSFRRGDRFSLPLLELLLTWYNIRIASLDSAYIFILTLLISLSHTEAILFRFPAPLSCARSFLLYFSPNVLE